MSMETIEQFFFVKIIYNYLLKYDSKLPNNILLPEFMNLDFFLSLKKVLMNEKCASKCFLLNEILPYILTRKIL